MCFGNKKDSGDSRGQRPVPYPNQQHDSKMGYPLQQQQHSYGPPSGPPQQQYAPPAGPPPGQQYAPPPGAPPSQSQFAPPPGPPPGQQHAPAPGHPSGDYTAPPPGPPPDDKKPLHDWETAVPDTSLFPPPPAFFQGWDRSPGRNASEEDSRRGQAYCDDNPLVGPVALDPVALEALRANNYRLLQPWGFPGELTWRGVGLWEVRTSPGDIDSSILTYPPMYAETLHSPLRTGQKHVVYYEVFVNGSSPREVCMAMGFCALPYPNFRCPGWHRGSLAVHGDDGHRYINDTWGGVTFTKPFAPGETYGIGMAFEPPKTPGGRIEVRCFFTRNGHFDQEWDIHEEQDARINLPVTGLEGYHDLAGAVGTFERVSFDVVFDPAKWKYRPS